MFNFSTEEEFESFTKFTAIQIIEKTNFSVIFLANKENSNKSYAIKRIATDSKNRELNVLVNLKHINVIKLKNYFYSQEKKNLYFVFKYYPETLKTLIQQYHIQQKRIPLIFVKIYMFQLCRAISYIHRLQIIHRDIKPSNCLIDHQNGILKLSDFGSAKFYVQDEESVCYICSRYYRAPELIFGSKSYTQKIDIWSLGCVFAELILGKPIFQGENGVDQLKKIILILGNPNEEEVKEMNPFSQHRIPDFKKKDWNEFFENQVSQNAIDLLSKMLKWSPSQRIDPLIACTHPFFDELKNTDSKLPNGNSLPKLFDLNKEEIETLKMIKQNETNQND
ncbi:protein kinase shaggy-related [Anaeramoeba ignava]|uniref:Protein kinase shaggy-related n=1 Tax=Anaeramoeba ignava TaxID=1746090 RepID=A0A9Q0L5U8_ANAIG|nr:protein kinase shaggy-related [Anaeramoeba ignava]